VTSERGALARALAAAWLLGAAAGCARGASDTFDCTCSYLTDFDDASTQAVTMCAPSQERAETFARSCAQGAAHAPVQRCSCRPAAKAPWSSCKPGECRAH
jgi:hypothetical protein